MRHDRLDSMRRAFSSLVVIRVAILSQTLAQTWRKHSNGLVRQSIPLPMRGSAGKQDSLDHRLLQIPLGDAPWHIREMA